MKLIIQFHSNVILFIFKPINIRVDKRNGKVSSIKTCDPVQQLLKIAPISSELCKLLASLMAPSDNEITKFTTESNLDFIMNILTIINL